MSLNCKGKDNAKPPLPTMSEYDDIKEVNKQNEDKGQISNDGSEEGGGDIEILDSSQVKTLMDLMMNHSQCSKKQRKHGKK